jgi:hypothetical protein
MGSNVNNKATSGGHEEVVFQSKDIASKTKAGQKKEYFVKIKKKSFGQRFSEWFTKYKKKILIIMCTVVLVSLAVFAAIKIITIISQPEEKTLEDWNDNLSETYGEIEDTLNSNTSDTPYTYTVEHYYEQYENETNPDRKFEIAIALGDLLQDSEAYEDAISAYYMIDENNITDSQKYIYYTHLRLVYSKMGNEDRENYCTEQLQSINIEEANEY